MDMLEVFLEGCYLLTLDNTIYPKHSMWQFEDILEFVPWGHLML